jgi:uncharacterized coiled-coil DUF342 family protein
MNNERLQHDVTIPRGEQQMGKTDFGGTSPKNMGLGEVAKEDKIQELLTHYTGDDYLKELLEDFKEGYDFNFDEDAIKEETEKIREMCDEIRDKCQQFAPTLENFKKRQTVIKKSTDKVKELVDEVKEQVDDIKKRMPEAEKEINLLKEKYNNLKI